MRVMIIALLAAISYAQTGSLNVRRDLQARRHCWKDSYGRGVGRPLNSCPDGQEKQGSLCYKSCKPGYKGRAHLCWQQCKDGERKIGTLCRVSWWRTYIRKSYNRGVGRPMGCGGSRSERQAGLCYTPCRSGYVGNGPVCWSRCANKFPVNGGALCCQTQADCASKIINMITGVNVKDPINSSKGFIMAKCSEVNSVSDGASFELIKSGHECKSSDSFLGKFSNVEDCANRAGETGSQFFVYGTDSKAGKCYNEFTRSASCPEGWERDSYNFYEIRSGPSELALGRPVAEIEGEETVGESSLADSSDSSSYSSSDYEDSSESSSDWEDSSASFEAFEEFGAYNVLFFDATKGVLALVGLVAILFGLYRMTCGKAKTYTEIDRLETQDGYGANGEC